MMKKIKYLVLLFVVMGLVYGSWFAGNIYADGQYCHIYSDGDGTDFADIFECAGTPYGRSYGGVCESLPSSCCIGKVYSKKSGENLNGFFTGSNVKCCSTGGSVLKASNDDWICCGSGEVLNNRDKCVKKCDGDNRWYGKRQKSCCPTDSLMYDWVKHNGLGTQTGYFSECGAGVLYLKGKTNAEGDVLVSQDEIGTDIKGYSFCGSGSVVTTDGRCVPCAGAASLSGVTVVEASLVNCHITCPVDYVPYVGNSKAPGCCPGTVKDNVCHEELLKMGVRVNNSCLINGQCGLNVYRILGIRASDNYDPSVSNVASDIINAAISILGTVVTIVFVVAGVICAMNSISGKDTKKMLKVFTDAAIGMLMVRGSYAIVRLVQFLATAGS